MIRPVILLLLAGLPLHSFTSSCSDAGGASPSSSSAPAAAQPAEGGGATTASQAVAAAETPVAAEASTVAESAPAATKPKAQKPAAKPEAKPAAKTAQGDPAPVQDAPTADGPNAKPIDPNKVENPYAPGSLGQAAPGYFLRGPGKKRFRYFPWEGEVAFNDMLYKIKLQEGSCEIRMLPGRYIVKQRIFVNEVNNLTFTGGPGVEFVFADGPDRTTVTTKPIKKGDMVITVAEPEKMREEYRYQLYQPDWRNDRLLELECIGVKDGLIYMKLPAHFMPHVKGEIPAGAIVMEELNMFRVRRCPGFVLQGISCDGRQRGGTRTHTTYCGVYATGVYVAHKRATTHGMTIRNSTFKNLKGRGVVFYGMDEVVIEGNYFENIRAQAIEIDHFSSGYINGNVVNGAEVGVMVNDAYESIVEANVLSNCHHGVRFLEIYKDDWVNSGNIIRDNVIGPGNTAGVHFFNAGMSDNLIKGNHFVGLRDEHRVINGEGNRIEWK